MPIEILQRLVWALAILAAGWLLFRFANRLILSRARIQSRDSGLIPNTGKPAILYFTTPDCVPCKTTQRPALARLKEQLGDRLEVVEVNAYEQPDIARRWGVMSVPTTFVISPDGCPRHVNHGVTSTSKLMEQVQDL